MGARTRSRHNSQAIPTVRLDEGTSHHGRSHNAGDGGMRPILMKMYFVKYKYVNSYYHHHTKVSLTLTDSTAKSDLYITKSIL
jgi:hypothetical protein